MMEIFIHPSENFGFVWSVDDWLNLRQNYRIVGNLIGSLSKYPRQNTLNGLPLCLHPEEVTLLREKRFAKLVSCPSLSNQPHNNLFELFEKEEKAIHEAQRKQYILQKETDVKRSYDAIIEGKNQKQVDFNSNCDSKKNIISYEVDKIQIISSNNTLSFTSVGDPWINDEEKIEPEWLYPVSDLEKLKYDVFKDLWEKNYYITPGMKFGGDFLCYSGDPVKFHAEFIVACVKDQEKLSAKDLVTFGRIGSSTKKTFTIATKVEGNIFYQSLQWIDNS